MFTLTRALAALLLAALGVVLGQAWQIAVAPDVPPSRPLGLVVPVFAVIGWTVLGGMVGRRLWQTVWGAIQSVAIAAIVAAVIAGVVRVFELGYRRRYDEVTEAIVAIPAEAFGLLRAGATQPVLVQALALAVLLGVVLHVLDRLLTARRNRR